MKLIYKFIITKIKKELRFTQSLYNLTLKSIVIGTLILTGIQFSLHAQDTKFTNSSSWSSTADGANFNFYRDTTHRLTTDPRLAFNVINDSSYQKPISLHNLASDPDINETLNNTEKSLTLVAPHPYFGQDQRSIESWNTTTVRTGIALKFGRGLTMSAPEKVVD